MRGRKRGRQEGKGRKERKKRKEGREGRKAEGRETRREGGGKRRGDGSFMFTAKFRAKAQEEAVVRDDTVRRIRGQMERPEDTLPEPRHIAGTIISHWVFSNMLPGEPALR